MKVPSTRRVYRVVKTTKFVMRVEKPYVLFGEELRRQRLQKNWTQQDLADKLKLSRGSVANIEVGRQRILLSDVFDFAKALGIKPIVLFNAVMD